MPSQHWVVRIGVKHPTYRSGNGATATYAATEAYGMISTNVLCKRLPLVIFRNKKKFEAAIADPTGWIGFDRIPGTIRCTEVEIVDTRPWLLHLEALEDGFYCEECQTGHGISYAPDHLTVRCSLCEREIKITQ